MTCKLGITFVNESKDFYAEKSGQSSCRRAKLSFLVGVRRRKRFRLDKNCLLRSSLHQYLNNQQPIIFTTTVSSGDIHAHPPSVIPSFGSNREHVTRKKVQSGFKHECLAAKHLNFERALDRCGHTAHYEELTEIGNRASKVSGIHVSDCLTA